MANTMLMQSLAGVPLVAGRISAAKPARGSSLVVRAASDKVFFPGVERPDYLAKADLAGDYGWQASIFIEFYFASPAAFLCQVATSLAIWSMLGSFCAGRTTSWRARRG